MPAFEYAVDIQADRAALFHLTQDYNRRLHWDPFLREARLTGGATEAGLGARAWCVATYGLGMETEYVSFKPPEVAAVKMTRGPGMLASFAGSWRFKEIGPERTRVIFRYHLLGSPRWLGFLLDPSLSAVFAYDTVKRLKALKRAVEEERILSQ